MTVPSPGRLRQMQVYVPGVGGARPRVPVAPDALEAKAARAMTPDAAAYVIGGAGMEATMRANRAAFERHRFVPRVLNDVAVRDLSVELFGRRHAAPLLLAPIGVLEMVHPDADLAVARAAAAEGIGYVFSNQASVALEKTAAAMGEAPRWFQLYWSSDDAFVASVVGRAEACGCEAIVVTLDTTLLGWRPRDLDRASLPFLKGQGLAQYLSDPVFRAAIPAAPPQTGAKPKGLGVIEALLSLRRKAKAFDLSLGQVRAAVGHFRRHLFAAGPDLGRHRPLEADDAAADPAQGRAPCRGCATGAGARRRRHRGVEPWRAPGRWRDRDARRAARCGGGGGRHAGAA